MIYDVLDIEDVAAQVGVKPTTVKYYWKHDRMPPADFLFNGTPGWCQQTINDWRPDTAPEYEDEGDDDLDTDWDEEESNVVAALYPEDDELVDLDEFDDGFAVDYGDDESLGMADALADMGAEFGELASMDEEF